MEMYVYMCMYMHRVICMACSRITMYVYVYFCVYVCVCIYMYVRKASP